MTAKEMLDAACAKYGWNESRIRKSFANKQGLSVMPEPFDGSCLQFYVEFAQVHERAYGFQVQIRVRLVLERECFEVFLCIDGNRFPLHKPVIVPLVHGFTAQVNQLHTAVSGLQYVYAIAGVECLDYYPDGMRERR